MSVDSHEARLIELELRFTEQQEALNKLSDVVWEQSKVIDRLQGEVLSLRRTLQAEPWSGEGGTSPQDEVPPHY